VTILAGIPFGAAFWMIVDEGALPLKATDDLVFGVGRKRRYRMSGY
jgi:hypothetical protein